MSPPLDTRDRGGPALLPKDHYSPEACANCHDAAGPYSSYRSNPNNFQFLPSPSECTAQAHWPDSLKTYSSFIQQNPELRRSNYFETLLQARRHKFPLEIPENSLQTLQIYLGLIGPVSIP